MDPTTAAQTIAGIAGVLGTAGAGAYMAASRILRQLSHDRVSAARDGAEIDHVKTLSEENNTLRARYDALQERYTSAVANAGELKGLIQAQSKQIDAQSQHIEHLEAEVEKLRATIDAQSVTIAKLEKAVAELAAGRRSGTGPIDWSAEAIIPPQT